MIYALKMYGNVLNFLIIKTLSVSTTAVHCINNMGSCRSIDCDKITKSIWDWAIKRRLWLSRARIPGRLNLEADEESRKTELRTEWKLNRTIYSGPQHQQLRQN